MRHETVLLNEAVDALCCKGDGTYIDGTFGRGGHSRAILSRLGNNGTVIGIDKDPLAIASGEKLSEEDARFSIEHTSFSLMKEVIQTSHVDGVLLDLGVSSPQLDDPERGFSFMQDGVLDMRMNPGCGQSALEWIASAEEEEIARVLWEYGEERFSRRMARAIVYERAKKPIERTGQLADIIRHANPKWEKHKHPATRAFQAIRIFINREMEDLKQALDVALELLKPGGRLVVISFHSLEDRIVKQFIRKEEKGETVELPRWAAIQTQPFCSRLRRVGKPVRASEDEVMHNPRARSAIMRVAEKCTEQGKS